MVTNDIEKEKENNSNMDTNSIIVRIESNKDYSESIVAQETSPAIQKHVRSNKTVIFDFHEVEGVVLCLVITVLLSSKFWLRKS